MDSIKQMVHRLYAMKKLVEFCNEPICDKYHITQTEAGILFYLHTHPTQNTATDIVECRYIAKANVSKAVDTLVKKGFLTRETASDDRRKIYLHLTDIANKVSHELVTASRKLQKIVYADVSDDEIRTFQKIYDKLASNAIRTLSGE